MFYYLEASTLGEKTYYGPFDSKEQAKNQQKTLELESLSVYQTYKVSKRKDLI